MSHTSIPSDIVTREQLEQFRAQIMKRFDDRIHLLIQQLLGPVPHPNEALDER